MKSESRAGAAQRHRRPKQAADSRNGAVDGERYTLRVLARALDVLDCFQDGDSSLNLKEVAARIDLPESTLFRILLTLKSQGYLVQSDDGSYGLPDKLLFGRLHERAERLRVQVRPYLSSLVRQFDETASLAYLFGEQVRVLDTLETFQEIRMNNRPGRVLPPHCSALGKAITAFQDSALIDRMLETYGLIRRTEFTVVDRAALTEEFAEIRERGYAVDRQETALGGICLAAPLQFPGKSIVAAISISTPIVRMSPERETEVRDSLVKAVSRASSELGQPLKGSHPR